jgi:hypothetical protein
MTEKKWPWFTLVVAALLSVAAAIGVWKLRSADTLPERALPSRQPSSASVDVPDADPNDLQSLERRLVAAGKLDDPEARDLITAEVAEALVQFHGKTDAKTEAPVAKPETDRPKAYDLPALRSEFDEARATKDTHLRRLALGAVAEFLAANDPEMALKWTEELSGAGARDPSPDAYAFVSVFAEAYARKDLSEAVEWASGLSNNTLRGVAHQYVAREWAPRDIGAVEAWIASTGDAGERSNIIRTVDNALRSADDASSSAWAQRLAANEVDGPRHSDVVVRHWARTDLDAAIKWGSFLPNPDDIERSVDGLVETFASKDPGEATRWAASFPEGPVKTRAVTQTAVYWAHFEPEAAARWIDTHNQPGILESTAPAIYSNLMAKDPAGAEAWLAGLPLREDFRAYVRSLNAPPVAADKK